MDAEDLLSGDDTSEFSGVVRDAYTKVLPLTPTNGSDTIVNATSTTFAGTPDKDFLPLALLIEGDPTATTAGLVVTSIMCGRTNQLMADGNVPGILGRPDLVRQIQFNVCPAGIPSSVQLMNVSAAPIVDVHVAFLGVEAKKGRKR